MRTHRNTLMALLLAPAMAAATPAQAAASEKSPEPVNPVEIGVFGGIHFYPEDSGLSRNSSDDTGTSPNKNGAVFGLRLTYNLNEWIGFEAEGSFSPTRTRNDSTRELIWGYRAHVIANFVHTGYVRPFALAGYGGLASFPGTFVENDGQHYPRNRDVDGFFHVGVGAKFPISDNFGLRLDGRCLIPEAVSYSFLDAGNESNYGGPDWELLLGAYIGLGAKAPAPAPAPAPKPAPAPVVEKDSDSDGILDKNDKCPSKAEDKDGFQDEDGCPDLDNDADGIADQNDKCPNDAEDKDGFQDEDGCPDADNDGDGILDQNDKCTNEPESVNGYQDQDGCPDEIPAAIKKFTGVIEGITFKTNSADVTRASHSVLDKAVKVLADYPDVRLEVGGHTDNVGKAEHNRELSQKRAEAVKTYLVGKGIASDRVTAVGYGMDKPLTSNKTAADKAKNRRTEFTLVGAAAK